MGFLLISAGCAIGLGNIWRFPYITGEYGGAAFVLLIVFFLAVLGLPVLVMEFAVGRASYRSTARSFDALEPRGTKWHRFKWVTIVGNYLLMMFYTSVCGWMIAYLVKMGIGTFNGAEDIPSVFSSMIGDPLEMTGWMLLVTGMGFAICAMGVQKGVAVSYTHLDVYKRQEGTSFTQEEALSNAPKQQDGSFLIPAILGGGDQ